MFRIKPINFLFKNIFVDKNKKSMDFILKINKTLI